MAENSLCILLVEDNPTDVLLLEEALKEVHTPEFVLTCVARLDGALASLHNHRFDVVLLDLGLPDSQGFETFAQMQREYPTVPILILSGLDDDVLAVRAVQEGAQDYLVKGVINSTMLSRTIRYAIERKRSEQRLMASEVSYRRLFETAQDGIFILDAVTGQITDANPCLEKLLGYKPAEFIGKRLWEIAPFRDKTANRAAFRTLQEKGYISYADLSLATRSGRFIAVEFVSNIYAVGGHRVIQCNIRDISERKQAVTEQERFFTLSLDMLCILDSRGYFERVNPAVERVLGFTPEELTGELALDYLHPEDRAASEHALGQLAAGLIVTNFINRFRCRDGSYKSILWATAPYDGQFYAAGRDITERVRDEDLLRKSEANLAVAQQMAHLGSWELDLSNLEDLNKNSVRWSDEAFRIFGYRPGQIEASNENFFHVVHPDDREQTIAAMSQAICQGTAFGIDHRILLPDGTERIVHEQAEFVSDASGRPSKMVGTVRDITEHMQAKQEIKLRPLLALTGIGTVLVLTATDYLQEHLLLHQGELVARLAELIPNTLGIIGIVYFILRVQEKVYHRTLSAIAERKQVEASLAESQRRLALATQAGHLGVWDWDVVADKLVWDKQMYALYGIREQEFSGAYDAWTNGLHPEDRAAATADMAAALDGSRDFHPQFRVVWPTGEVRHIEAHAVVQRASNGSALNVIGVNWDITERKTTEQALRVSEEHFRFLDDVVDAARALIDPAQIMEVMARMLGQHLRASRCAYADVEVDGEQFTILHDYSDGCASTVGSYQLSLFGARAVATLNRGETLIIRNVEEELLPDEGADMFNVIGIKAIITCPLIKAGVLRAMMAVHQTTPRDWQPDEIAIVQDVVERCWATIERRTVEEKLHLLNAELEQRVADRTGELGQANIELRTARETADTANLAKSEFLSRMSHELRTPLNAILGFGQILEMQDPGPRDSESIKHILKGGRHLLALINEVLDIARVEAGHLELSLEPVSISEVITESLDLTRPLAAQHNIQIDGDEGMSCTDYVMADRQRLKQVLINLLSNAIKYNPRGGSVIFSCRENAAGRIRIRVTDTGPGITAQDLEKLFVPFERLDAEKSGIEGTGLGLAFSKRLVEAMGGTIDVESVVGPGTLQGSTFTVELPRAEAPRAEASLSLEAAPESVSPLEDKSAPTTIKTVLSIEDNASNYRLIESILSRRPGIKLLGAMQGRVGLDLAFLHHPDLILLDLHLPDIMGHEVLRQLQENPQTRDIPVVIVSADATAPQIERLLASGVRAYLTKPLDVKQLLEVVEEMLKGDD
jgi:PAS domain S-box-containing protein